VKARCGLLGPMGHAVEEQVEILHNVVMKLGMEETKFLKKEMVTI